MAGNLGEVREFQRYVTAQIAILQDPTGPESLALPASLNAAQRRYVHQAAQQQGLSSASVGEGAERHITIYKAGAANVPTREEQLVQVPREEQLSRTLSSLLRHTGQHYGLVIEADGYTRLDAVLALPWFRAQAVTEAEVAELVSAKDDKKRFSLIHRLGHAWVRANQGHTIRCVKDTQLLEQITDPEDVPCCVHGTYFLAWAEIVRGGGLSRMRRNHIHFAPEMPESGRVISGMRPDCEVAVFVDVSSAMDAGIIFLRSANGVILTRGDDRGMLPLTHITRAVRLSDWALLWPWVPDEDSAAANQESSDEEVVLLSEKLLGSLMAS